MTSYMASQPLRNQKLEYLFLPGRQVKSQQAHRPMLPLCSIFTSSRGVLPLCAIFTSPQALLAFVENFTRSRPGNHYPTGAAGARRWAGADAGVALPLVLCCAEARATVAVFLRAAGVFAVAFELARAVPVVRLCAVEPLVFRELAVRELALRAPVMRSPG